MTEQAETELDAKRPILQGQGLSKVYETGEVSIHALRGVDVTLYESELVVLLGASGSGKSTLLNILGGLDLPTSGNLTFRNQFLDSHDDAALTTFRRDHVGFVFQFYNLIASLTAAENVALVTEIAQNPMKPAEALALVGLADRCDAFPAQLSGGEQQRVAIARAIAKRPQILLCDEPTGALDSKTGVLVLEAINQVNQQMGTTTAVITHNRSIAGMADRVLDFADGQIISSRSNTIRINPGEIEW